MKVSNTSLSRVAFSVVMIALALLLLLACGVPSAWSEVAALPAMTVDATEGATAALRPLHFDAFEDSLHLALPTPLIFPFASTRLTPDARQSLLAVGRELKHLDVEHTLVWGYTDNVGAASYNLALSTRRAAVVARVLIEAGYPGSRIEAKGLGASLPIADNRQQQGRAQNRRVVIVVQAS